METQANFELIKKVIYGRYYDENRLFGHLPYLHSLLQYRKHICENCKGEPDSNTEDLLSMNTDAIKELLGL